MRELALLARRARTWQAWPAATSSGLSGCPPQLVLHSAYSTGDKTNDKEEGSLLLQVGMVAQIDDVVTPRSAVDRRLAQGVETAPFHLSLEALRRSNSAVPYSQLILECQDR